jgi:hypothetical protein
MIWRNESARGSRHRAKALLEGNDDGWLEDAPRQLEAAARAVYRSWMSARARAYRRLQGLERLPGTAVTVQAMVGSHRAPGLHSRAIRPAGRRIR